MSSKMSALVGLVGLLAPVFGGCVVDSSTMEEATDLAENEVNAAGLSGWAAASGLGRNGTIGGRGGETVTAKTLSQLTGYVSGSTRRIVKISGHIKGDVTVGSNKTITGDPDAVFEGHVELSGSSNVILNKLKIVGYNCGDKAVCEDGKDAVTITKGSHHVWVDHCDISDGSDGNLDIVHGSDFITVSWTKFSYSQAGRAHRFSNLIGHDDGNGDEDSGHLRVTFHHDWWAGNVDERMPRVRFGQVHLFNNLFTSTGNNYALRAGASAQILSENNVFMGVDTPFDISGGKLVTKGDSFKGTTGNKAGSGSVFTPQYSYTKDSVASVSATVKAGAGSD